MSTSVRVVKTPDVLPGKPRVDGIRVSVLDIDNVIHRHGQSTDRRQRGSSRT